MLDKDDLKRRRFAIQRKRVSSQQLFIAAKIRELAPDLRDVDPCANYDDRPWDLLQDLNALSHDYLKRDFGLRAAFESELSKAAFDVALQYDRIESAADFLMLMPRPDAKRIHQLLFQVARAIHRGGIKLKVPHVEKWLNSAECAVAECPDWGLLNAESRLNAHEILMGRFIKLAKSLQHKVRTTFLASLNRSDSDDEIGETIRDEQSSVHVAVGEMTLDDLQRRLEATSARHGSPVAALSLYIAPAFVSYVGVSSLPRESQCAITHGVRPIDGIGSSLSKILTEKDYDLRCEDLDDLVRWPQSFYLWFKRLIEDLNLLKSERVATLLLAVNTPYHGLPWQHLAAAVSEYAPNFPLVTIAPNFGTQLASERVAREPHIVREPDFVCYPEIDATVSDTQVATAYNFLYDRLLAFNKNPKCSLGLAIAHGDADQGGAIYTRGAEIGMPNYEYGKGERMTPAQLDQLLRTELLLLLICLAGAPRKSVLNDIGGVLSPFLIEQHGLMFAPVGEVPPLSAAALAAKVLEISDRNEAMGAYGGVLQSSRRHAHNSDEIDWNRGCYLFNAYGQPTRDFMSVKPLGDERG